MELRLHFVMIKKPTMPAVTVDKISDSVILTHCGLGDFNEILEEYFSSQLQWLMAEMPAVKFPLEECH